MAHRRQSHGAGGPAQQGQRHGVDHDREERRIVGRGTTVRRRRHSVRHPRSGFIPRLRDQLYRMRKYAPQTGELATSLQTPNGASRRSAQAPAEAQYTPPQRQQPRTIMLTTAATQCGQINAPSICKSPQNASRGNARRETNRRRTRTRCKVKGDAEKHLLFHIHVSGHGAKALQPP